MSIIQEIHSWALTQPLWQQDAIARLFSKGQLDTNDYDDLYALLKSAFGILDPKNRVATKLGNQLIAPPQLSNHTIRLLGISNLKNVNALAEKQMLPLNPDGLTVIYGNNGSGKSGYSRALKKVCRARDQNESILPNANLPATSISKAEATFDIQINGVNEQLIWTDGTTPPEELSSILIFDSRCARAYLDDHDDFSYVPYGLDILSGLAGACNRLKVMLDTEYGQSTPNLSAFYALSTTSTEVGKLLTNLSAKTSPQLVESLTTLPQKDIDRHIELEKSLKEANPKEKALQLRLTAGRFKKLAVRCNEKQAAVSDIAANKLKDAIEQQKTARAAADLAAKQFRETPGQLPGTGGDTWQILFEAARKFALESHPENEFPNLGIQSPCPLCQEPLTEGASLRLIAFDTFIQQEAEKTAKIKREEAISVFNNLKQADLNINFDTELKAELSALDTPLAQRCDDFQSDINTRRSLIKNACSEGGNWENINTEPKNPASDLHILADKLETEATAMEAAADENARTAVEIEFKELDARKQLAIIKNSVLEAISKLDLQAKLSRCQNAIKTNPISIKSTDLNEKVVSKDLEDALNAEFKAVNVGELQVKLKSSSSKGKTLHKLVLKLPSQQNPSLILSEGEQRAIAIASFLAEVNISGGTGAIVFDDPVSSLDHLRRELVAHRLAQEAKKRQVIVFTHDVYFMCILQQEAESLGVAISSLSLNRKPEGYGVASNQLPFEGAKTTSRIGMLKQLQVECATLHKTGDYPGYRRCAREIYTLLRVTWERAIEEVLFQNVVVRFRESIESNRLKTVVVEDEDYKAIDLGMTKCSKCAPHDRAALGNIATPHPDEILSDIEALETWRKTIIARTEDIRKRR
jgi:recombinational DNA repair ATPase RecF